MDGNAKDLLDVVKREKVLSPSPPLVLLRLSRHWSFLREIVVNNVVSKNWTRESTIVGHAKIIVLDRLERFVFQWNRLWLTKNDIREIGREMWRWSRGGSRTRRRSWPRRSTGTGTTWPRGWGRSTTKGGSSRWRFLIDVDLVVLIQSLVLGLVFSYYFWVDGIHICFASTFSSLELSTTFIVIISKHTICMINLIKICFKTIMIPGDPTSGEHGEGEQERHHGAVRPDQEIRGGGQDWQWRGEKFYQIILNGKKRAGRSNILLLAILRCDKLWREQRAPSRRRRWEIRGNSGQPL